MGSAIYVAVSAFAVSFLRLQDQPWLMSSFQATKKGSESSNTTSGSYAVDPPNIELERQPLREGEDQELET